eukprot:CAMPEP_0184860392 /NCGR_PEP_ID=MMETSP0580-20130426/5289_1 /TAXON_ID=1118495 /ORGANISM="Dactyliosolen fragilissimus" /LENGTH=422 /DNA_ID=CAMNT_0027357481 /DNA_START=112 /DNA_END=1377 /DNA_ORIENTATION=+
MSKLNSVGLTLMGRWLRSLSKQRYHFYGVNLSENHPQSLARLIGIKKEQLDVFFLATGLGKVDKFKKDGSVVYLKEEWDNLLHMNQLGECYFDKFYVKQMPGDELTNRASAYTSFWIGIGGENKLKNNPSTQFQHNAYPPHIRMKNTASFRRSIILIEQEYKQKLEDELNSNNKMDTIGYNKQNINFENTRQVLRHIEPLASMKDVINVMQELIRDRIEKETKSRNEFLNKLIGKDGSIDDIDEFVDKEEKQKRFGVLESFGIPIHNKVLSLILKEIIMIAKEHPKREINYFENWRGNKQAVVLIPQCKNEQTFERMNRRSNWLDDIPCQIVGKYSYDPSEAAKWMIQRLGSKHPTSFKDAATDLGYAIDGKVMDQCTADAMWEEANMNSKGQRIILRYLKGFFGRRIIVPSWTRTLNDYNN